MNGFMSVAEAAQRFKISNRRVQMLCEQGRIENAQMISGVWLIPSSAQKPCDGRKRIPIDSDQLSLFDTDNKTGLSLLTFEEACSSLSISLATGRNWIRLGKLIPEQKDGRKYLFLRSAVENILNDIANGNSKALRQRRNKKKMTGVSAYENYISSSHNVSLANSIISEFQHEMNNFLLRSILANIALQFICYCRRIKKTGNVIRDYLRGELTVGSYDVLIDDLLGDKGELIKAIDVDDDIFNLIAEYVSDEDTLGFVYISLVNSGNRKAAGAYYTPLVVVNKLVAHLSNAIDLSGKSIFDPCCGAGNFLLTIGKYTDTPELIYGQDIDLIAVQLARISFALKYDFVDNEFLYTHFTCADTLDTSPQGCFDIVLGNPPWGGELSKERLEELASKYQAVVKNGAETYDLFVERGLSLTSKHGMLAFVLPEAILNVAAHTVIRKILISRCNFRFVQYLGNVFDGVQCPSVILGVEIATEKTVGVDTVYSAKSDVSYSISSNRQITPERFNFHVCNDVQDCLDAMCRISNSFTLLGNAKFALGIVTGDNANYTSNVCLEGYEPVLKGSDIKKYRFKTSEKYIRFIPQDFQQVAPTELYRAPEKLFYRFICESLVFAYDNNQTLSLNSCNILIPQIPNMSLKYILAILNSRAANFYFSNMFNSIKVLRSHIEQIPIPAATINEQRHIVALVERILEGGNDVLSLYNELDDCVMSLYDLNGFYQDIIGRKLEGRSMFLT